MEWRQFERWLQRYGEAWEGQNADSAAGLFTENAKYYETPFDEPMVGRDRVYAYWREGTGAQREVRFGYDVLAINRDMGIARWTASFTRVPSGIAVRLDGILTVLFEQDGRCSEFREWWHRQETPAQEGS